MAAVYWAIKMKTARRISIMLNSFRLEYPILNLYRISICASEQLNLQGPAMEPFENDLENEKYYAGLLHVNTVDSMDDTAIEADMETALKEYDRVSADLGVFPKSCRALVADPSQLTRWIIGEERLHKL